MAEQILVMFHQLYANKRKACEQALDYEQIRELSHPLFLPILITMKQWLDNNLLVNAAQNAAKIYSFKGTCKINNIEPHKWLKETDVLREYPAYTLQELLPLQ